MGTDEDPPKKYDQEFFLDLAAKGKDVWNAWRRDPANKGVRVTFAGVDFSVAPRDQIDFEGFEFGDYADFSQCKWQGGEWRIKDFRPGRARFAGAAFGHWARFAGAAFGYWASFADGAFGDFANFAGAAFGDGASFAGAAFGNNARFAGTTFGNNARFAGAAFGDIAIFAGAAFGDGARFADTFFKGRVEFAGMSEDQWARDVANALAWNEKDRKMLEKRHKDSWETIGSGLDRFLTISFSRARFDGVAVFSGRSFEKTADFTNARFYSPPDFDWCGGTARIDFTSAYIGFARPGRLHWITDTEVPLRLRSFRKIAEEAKNHDLERDLYIEERKAERGVYWRQLLDELKKAPEELKKNLEDIDKQKKHVWLERRLHRRARNAHVLGIVVKIDRLAVHGFWIAVMGIYWALADYGRSFARPAVWLVSSVWLFHWGYAAVLARLMPKAGPLADKYEHAVGMVALGNAVPFVGPLTIDTEIKKFLFCPNNAASCLPPIPPEGFQFLVIFQNPFLTCVFFIGLALRNYFRIK